MLYEDVCKQIVRSTFECTQPHNFQSRRPPFMLCTEQTMYWVSSIVWCIKLWSCVHSKIDPTWIPYSFDQTPWVLFFSLLVFVWLLFEGGDYSRAVSIRRNTVPSYNTSNSRHSGWRHKLIYTSLELHYVSYTCNHDDQNMIKVTQILLSCRTRPTTCMGTEFLKRKINTKPVAFCMVFTHCQVDIKCWFVCIH